MSARVQERTGIFTRCLHGFLFLLWRDYGIVWRNVMQPLAELPELWVSTRCVMAQAENFFWPTCIL
jgi:hypothetical protein